MVKKHLLSLLLLSIIAFNALVVTAAFAEDDERMPVVQSEKAR